jgi:hypothetical protein
MQSDREEPRALTTPMRVVFFASLILTFIGFVNLYVFANRTEDFSPWTIKPALSAAFLGAGFGAGFVLFLVAMRERSWVRTRIVIVTVWEFTVFMLIATLLHRDKFHLHAGTGVGRVAAWLWLIVYIAFPIVVGVLLVLQERTPGTDPPVTRPLPRTLMAALVVQGTLMVATGTALFVAPTRMARSWPWPLTPLTARAIGAWFLALGIAAFHAILERDLPRLRPAAITYLAFALLQFSAVLRFRDDFHLDGWGWVYLAWLASVAIVGAYGTFVARSQTVRTLDLTSAERRRVAPDRRTRARARR